MKYKITVGPGGKWDATVIDRGKHVCSDIVATVGAFGNVENVKDKKDDVPVRDNVQVGGVNV